MSLLKKIENLLWMLNSGPEKEIWIYDNISNIFKNYMYFITSRCHCRH